MADTIKKETFTVRLTYEMSVNIDTGEILETRLINRDIDNSDFKGTRSSKKKVIQDEDKDPKLILEDNKYRLNTAAVELMGLNENSKLNIRYEQGKNGDIPLLGTDEAFGVKSGNRITKSNTVACRGSKNEELAKYGKEFILVPHPNKPGIFILTSETVGPEQLIGDNNVSIEGGESDDLPFDLDIKDLVEDEDVNTTEIDSNFFKL